MASPSQRSAPISHHPLFPTIVALWFAALLGLGSIVVRASVLERIVLAAHIDVLIPAAAPPLGFTARLLLTLVMTFGGGVLGFVLARRLASAAPSRRAPAPVIVPEPVQPARDDSAAAASDDDDDGEDLARLDAARAAQPRRRRGLTADESAAPTTLPDAAPLPGRTPPMLTLGDLDSLPPLGPVTPEVPASAEAAPAPAPTAPPPVELAKTALDFPLRMPPALAPLPLAASAPADASAADRLRGEPLEALGTVELVERFALALAARRAGAESTAEPVQPLAEADRRTPAQHRFRSARIQA